MPILIFLLLFVWPPDLPPLPPPWAPDRPLAQPIALEYSGASDVTMIVRDDGAIAAFTPHVPRLCYTITARDSSGQEYHYQQRRGCGLTTFVPLIVQEKRIPDGL